MKLNNVFYGFTKNGERKLLWKKYITEETTMGDVSRTIYYDLEENEYIEEIYIDVESLVPIVNLVGDYKRKSKRKIIKAYKDDCNLSFEVTGAFYGDIVTKTTLYDLKTANGYYMGSGRKDLYDEVLLPEEQNVLFVRKNSLVSVQNVKNSKTYPWSNVVRSGVCVKRNRSINTDKVSENVISKKKLLEMDYRKEL